MIPLAIPDLNGNEKKYLNDCIDSTYVSSVGEFVNRFEKEVARATGSEYAVATSSGTTGLHVALVAAGVNRDELVILPTFTFIASANAIRHCGAEPWLMDIRIEDWCLDPGMVRIQLEKECEPRGDGVFHIKSGKRVAAIMPVYTLGNIPNMDEFRAISKKYHIPLVVDAACAIGASYKDQPFGGLAEFSVLSFNGNKTVTCGGGGAVIGNDQELLSHVRHLTTTARVWPDYDFDEVGYNYRMTNIQAAVGVAQMERLQIFVGTKRKVRKYYETKLSDLKDKGVSFFPSTQGSSCWYSGVVLPEGTDLDRTRVICCSLKEEGIEARVFWKPVHMQKPYMKCNRSGVNETESLWQRIVTLPCSVGIKEEELETTAQVVKKMRIE